MYKILLIDMDNTLLNFDAAEERAMKTTFQKYGIEWNTDNFQRFRLINIECWKQYEIGKISKQRLLTKRFEEFFEPYFQNKYMKIDSSEVNEFYLNALSSTAELMPYAKETLDELYKLVKIYPVTNGVTNTQKKRIDKSGLKPFFTHVFISEELGVQKPKKEFFDIVFKSINSPSIKDVLLVGDSLTADIKGALDYGIDACWYNPNMLETDLNPKYIINSLLELLKIIKNS